MMLLAAAFALLPAASAAPEPCSAVPPSSVVEDLKLVLAEGRFDDVVARVTTMEANLLCLEGFAAPGDLSTVYQLAGAGAFYGQDLPAATQFFERAVVLGPQVPFDAASLGPTAAASYAEVQERVQQGALGEVEVIGPVVLDGVGLQTGSRVFRPVGEHLLQVVTDEGVTNSLVVLPADGVVRVGQLDPEALARQQLLWKRRQITSFSLAGALTATAGGLYYVALQREQELLGSRADASDDPFTESTQLQRQSQLAMSGAVLSLAGAVTFTFTGVRATKERSR